MMIEKWIDTRAQDIFWGAVQKGKTPLSLTLLEMDARELAREEVLGKLKNQK